MISSVKQRLPLWKRPFDVLVAAVGLIVCAPLLAFVGAAVRLAMGRPVLFRQVRPGLHGKAFTLIKFRTMRENERNLGQDQERLTPLGRFLRQLSLDELPQLYNVLRGEMSLVGPRPLMMEYLDRYTPEQARRHDVLPGITGWSQVNGRNTISWKRKLELDVWYVDNMSFWLDLKILGKTILKAFTGREICPATEFTGSQQMPHPAPCPPASKAA